MRSPALIAIVAAVLGACVACGTSNAGPNGDCTVRLQLDGHTYDSTTFPDLSRGMVRQPFADGAKVQATEIDCDGSTIDKVEVQQIQGVPLSDAVYADDGTGVRVPYFNTTLRAEPIAFRAATLPVQCNEATTITGRIESIGDEDFGTGALKTPYTAQILASSGTGLPFEQWAALDVDVTITSAVPNAPTRDQIDSAIAKRNTIDVTAHCDGSTFVADTFTLAG